MGNFERSKVFSTVFKMGVTTWLSIALAVLTFAAPASSSEPRVVCYYTNWSVYRPGTARFNPQNINPYLCTHLIYAFGGFTKDNTLKPFDKYQDIEKGGYAKFTGLKTYNKNLKTMLAIGGWNEGSTRFSPMVASRERRKEFVRNAIKFLRQNHFDGLDLDWEYPAFRDGGKPKDREHYAKLVKELREEFERESEKTGKPRLLLTMAVPAGIEYIQKGFDVKSLNRYLDWMNLLTYDYHSAFEPAVNHHAPLYPLEEPNEYSVDNELNIDYTIKFYLENGADRDKLVLGIPTYGRSYTLFNPDAVEIGSPADGPGEQGDATREKGYLAYYEICDALKDKRTKRAISSDDEESDEESSEEEVEDEPWTVMYPNKNAMGPVAYKGNQWVGYDDIDIVQKKAEYVAENGLGGIMFWSIDNDDFRGTCHGKPYPLIEAAKEAYISKIGSTDNAVERPKPSSSSGASSRRRNRPTSTTTARPTTAKAKANRKSGASTKSTTPTWNIATPEPPTTPDPGSDFKCTDEGFFQHPRDCKKYFWCLDSGPSNLGIVAHQFTCPSGLFFNKAADSCDFARNVLCKKPSSTTAAPTTKAATSTTTTRRPVKLSTKSSVLFRTTSTTTSTTPEPEEEYEDEVEDSLDVDAEDPKVIKELIDLIKKVGGVEQLEKQLHLSESASPGGASTTTPSSFNKNLYKKVLERTIARSKQGSNSVFDSASQNRQRGPQNAGLAATADKDKLLRKDRPQYTTINRARASTTQEPIESEEEIEVRPNRARAVDAEAKVATTAKPLQYVNIRRARPTVSTSDTADDTASRNALFERPASFVAVSDTPESLDIQSARRENSPEYVTIRRQRPTTEEATTAQYQTTEGEEESQETILEKEISSPSLLSQPQYTSIVRARSTTSPPSEEPDTPEPTTVLSVQISSLLNSPEAETSPEPVQTTEITEPPTTTTTTTTTAAPSSVATRRTILRRRGSTTTTTSTAAPSTTQVSSRNYTFVRRRRPVARPNEITSDSDETAELSRKIRSTTPDSREISGASARAAEEARPVRRYRSRLQSSTDDSIPAEASTVPRGQFRPHLEQDEIISLTPVDFDSDTETPSFVPRQSFSPRRFRGRTSTTLADKAQDSEVSAATLDVRRPSIIPRGRGRFTVSSTTEGLEPSTSEATLVPRRPAFARFTPRPFSRSTTLTSMTDDDIEEDVDEIVTKKTPPRFSFSRSRPSSSTAEPTFQARKVSFPSRQTSTQQTLTSDIDEEEQDKNEDITLSESAIEEKEHDELTDANEEEEETNETPKGRIVIKRLRTPPSSTTESTVSTETIPINNSGKKKFRVIRRRPTSTSAPEEPSELPTEPSTSITPRNKIRKVIRKKIKPAEDEPEIIAKSVGSLNAANQVSSTEVITNYGEKTRPSVISSSTEVPTTTTPLPEKEVTAEAVDNNKENESSEKEGQKISEEITTESPQINQSSIKEETPKQVSADDTSKPEVSLETDQKAIDLSENESHQPSIEPSSESPATEAEEPSPETTTTSTTQQTSPSTRSRAPYRPPKRLFTSTTESSSPLSSRTFSRKFNPGVYTSPATVDRDTVKPSTRRPFSSRTFTRRPFSTSTTTPEPEDEEFSEEILDVEPEEELVVVPPSKLFTRKPDFNDDDFQDSEEASDDETSEEDKPTLTSRKPYRPRVVNSNTFRTSTSTTELPKRFGSSQNRTSIYNRSSPNKPVDPKAKRVQNVPTGYNRPATSLATEATSAKSESSDTTDDVTEESTTTNASTGFDMSTDGDDYLSVTEIPGTTITEKDESLSTNTIQSETATAEMEIDDSTDDFLEYTEPTTNYPSTHDTTLYVQTETENIHQDTEVTTEIVSETTAVPTAAPVIKTQFDKLFSVSRVVEVSSKLDKHRLNKNNESRLIEEGKIMIEKKPMVDKIGEVSRFSLIKIVEDEIPIYLTKYGHIYPVENPPDNPIRIDEGRNARALTNFAEGPRENLVASESINEAYRHVTKEANKPSSDVPKHRVEHIQSDDFLSYINDDKKSDKSSENSYPQWQFIPAAYENEQNKQNKAAKSFEIITPRSMLTNPSTLPLEALFKTENPKMAKKINDERGSQPFVVYSASVPSQNEEANIVKVEVLKPEVGRSIVTFAKGLEFQGASVDQSTIQYPINITVLPKTSTTLSTTTTVLTTSTEKPNTSPIIELLTTQPTTLATATEVTATEMPPTTETMPEEITTVKISPLDAKRKFAFPRRPVIKPSNLTRVNPVPRTSKKINATVVTNNLKSNKTSGFNPSKSRFTANRAQNVPVDFRKKANTPKVTSKVTTKSFTTEAPRTTTERKLYFKPIRPNLRPAFVPRKSTTVKSPKDRRKPFLRSTKATSPPDATETETDPIDTETTTNKYTRRGNNKFKSRKEALNAGRKDTKKNEIEVGTRRPSLSTAARSERPTRNFARRRPGGANATTPLPSESAASSTVAPAAPRRPFRVASRRRPAPSTSTQASTAGLASEESLQDIEDTDSIEDPALVSRAVPKKMVKIQRRPLVSLKDEARDQNPSATNEEERKRQSKKYSSSIKQNQLEELKSKGQETTTASSTTAEDYSAETAVAIAAHQLLIAPVPNIPNYDEEPQPAKKSTGQAISDYSYTSPQYTDFTDSKTVYSEEFPSTTNFESSSLKNNISPSTGAYEDTTTFIPKTTYNSLKPITTPVYLTLSRSPLSTPSVVSQGVSGAPSLGPSTAQYARGGDKYVSVPAEDYGYSTAGYTGQEPSYFTREYLLESPVTKTYDDEYQYLAPVTTAQTPRQSTRKTIQRKISTTLPPTLPPVTTPKPRRVPSIKFQKPFEKIAKPAVHKPIKPIENYDYYDDGEERKTFPEETKVVLHDKGVIECLDIGNFPHPSSCKKFISCARIDNGSLLGWEYICPKGLSFDPVGGICNWSAGLGCSEKDL